MTAAKEWPFKQAKSRAAYTRPGEVDPKLTAVKGDGEAWRPASKEFKALTSKMILKPKLANLTDEELKTRQAKLFSREAIPAAPPRPPRRVVP